MLMSHTETEYGNDSPTRENESRDSVDIECKLSTNHQLKANMNNLLVREFIQKVMHATDDGFEVINTLEILTIYGMSFGVSRPVEEEGEGLNDVTNMWSNLELL